MRSDIELRLIAALVSSIVRILCVHKHQWVYAVHDILDELSNFAKQVRIEMGPRSCFPRCPKFIHIPGEGSFWDAS